MIFNLMFFIFFKVNFDFVKNANVKLSKGDTCIGIAQVGNDNPKEIASTGCVLLKYVLNG